jgi:hypothetical protein
MFKYMSIAHWPEGTETGDPYGKPITTDKHMTEGEAEAVCKMLKAEGYGGDKILFPVKTEVVKIK